MQKRIDLNADLGELDGSLDAALMSYISSCNIACGSHAGTPQSMRRSVRLAKKKGVVLGAHPGYPDLEHAGRLSLAFQPLELCALIRDQILLLKQIAAEEGAVVYHVKLHGALYNDLAFDYPRSLAVAQMIAGIDPDLRFIVFSGSETARAAEDAGLVAIHEVFADRRYTEAGRLVPRSQPGAVLHNEADALMQAAGFIRGESGLIADSICVHGDNPSALTLVSNLRRYFESKKMTIQAAGKLEFSFSCLGERSLLAQLPPRIAQSTHRKIRSLQWALEGEAGIVERVPCYAELKIDFDPAIISIHQLEEKIRGLELSSVVLPAPRSIEIPVCYQGENLARVAAQQGLTEAEVIRLHAAPTYRVYLLGFSPGFAYMGGLNPKLATPRLETPRISVPAGSVGIAGHQTGIYPVASPGGWNIIGRTPLNLFDPAAAQPFLFEPGDEVTFLPVSSEEFDAFG
ncbi:MAG: 5-oxoprolinase subunit PxpB [Pontiella sp.]